MSSTTVQGPGTRTSVGKYELGKTLGEGSFAKVKFAKNIQTGDSFAIKIIDRDRVLRHKMVEQVASYSYPCFLPTCYFVLSFIHHFYFYFI